MAKKQTNYTERNYGIDLLRIVAMIFIPILHVLGQGGILSSSVPLSVNFEVAWFLEIMAYCAVNCYALISGYVGYGYKYRYSNIIYILLQVLIYTIITTGIFMIFKPEIVGIKDIIKAIFPFAFNVYWYFTAYFCMFFFIPFINYFVEKASKEMSRNLLWTIIILFSIIPTLFHNDVYKVDGGYSAFWLSMMYFIGAYIKKYGINTKINAKRCFIGYLICIIVTWVSKFILDIITNMILGEPHGGVGKLHFTNNFVCRNYAFIMFFKFRKYMEKIYWVLCTCNIWCLFNSCRATYLEKHYERPLCRLFGI
jgi:surface polysaccharide O-acyltransferase-like enzyme